MKKAKERCPHCGRKIPAWSTRCPKCGKLIPGNFIVMPALTGDGDV